MKASIGLSLLLATWCPVGAGCATRARHVITVADDFVVEVYHNGKRVPDNRRKLLLNRYGATVERIDIEVREGDWLVFNVVNNRFRWGGAYYFAVAGVLDPSQYGFVSELKSGNWSACDDLPSVPRFIRERDFLSDNPVTPVAKPWHEGEKYMKKHAGPAWAGEPIWGRERNTWIKIVVPHENKEQKGTMKKWKK